MTAKATDPQIGTMTLTRFRVVPLDANGVSTVPTQVAVQPGVFPLHETNMGARYWMLAGNASIARMGDGLFTMSGFGDPDTVEGPEVTIPSRLFGPEEWDEFVADPVVAGPDPRWIITLNDDAT